MAFKAFEDYLNLEKNYSPHTVKAYTDDLGSFAEFIQNEFAEEHPEKANYSMIRSWIVHLIDQGLNNNSVNRKISSLQAYYKFLLRTRQIEASPLIKHKSLKVAEKVQIPFSEKEMEQVFSLPVPEGFEGIRDRLILELFYATGIRRAELISIKTEDLQSDKNLKIRGKGNKERLIPLLPVIGETLVTYLAERDKLEIIRDTDYLFLTKSGKKLYPMLVYRVINEYFSAVSTKTKTSPHILRHSFATHLLNNGADINSIKNLLGHSSLSSTQIYTHNDIAALKKVYAKSHPRSRHSGR